MNELRFAWWNLQDFAHFNANRLGVKRWPESADEYAAKCRAVDAAFDRVFGTDPPEVIGLCEVTETAAQELRQRKFPGHTLVHPGSVQDAEFQVALLYRRTRQLRGLAPVSATEVPRSTRDMPLIQLRTDGYCVRFIFCHWTAFGDRSAEYRGRLADAIRRYVFAFQQSSLPSHVAVVGDLNAEPFEPVFADRVEAHRDHDSARSRRHATDADVRRVRLYNCGWRLLGEQHPHTPALGPVAQSAGTCFGEAGWKTYDQVLLSGGLLSTTPPYLDEAELRVAADTGLLDAQGRPAKFEYQNGQPQGVSDHLPLVGRIVLA